MSVVSGAEHEVGKTKYKAIVYAALERRAACTPPSRVSLRPRDNYPRREQRWRGAARSATKTRQKELSRDRHLGAVQHHAVGPRQLRPEQTERPRGVEQNEVGLMSFDGGLDSGKVRGDGRYNVRPLTLSTTTLPARSNCSASSCEAAVRTTARPSSRRCHSS